MKFITLAILLCSFNALSYETDQFTTPAKALPDMGEEFSRFMMREIEVVVERANHKEDLLLEIKKIESEKLTKSSREKIESLKIEYDLSQTPSGVTKLIGNHIGHIFFIQDQRDGVFGLPLTIFPYPDGKIVGEDILFNPKKTQTIYALSGFHRGISASFFVFCSTIRAYGHYFGVDKLGHMFNQGIEYFDFYKKAKSETEAMKTILDFGIASERGMFGLIVDGVYSNGDLAANMSGFYFYRNLFESIDLDGVTHSPLLSIENGRIIINKIDHHQFLAKFFTNHLNEALNPSHIEKMQRKAITKAIIKRCPDFLNFYEIKDKTQISNDIDSMNLWYGKNYGHNNEALLRLDDLCY